MIDHIGLKIADFERSKAFYLAALRPLGYALIFEGEEGGCFAGFGADGKPDFWIAEDDSVSDSVHVAILAKDRATVRAFYETAMAAGGRDNGAPGVREIYHPTYYGAFVLDPDGHNIEAVCHDAE